MANEDQNRRISKLSEFEQKLKNIVGMKQVAVWLEEQYEQRPHLHLQDILPDKWISPVSGFHDGSIVSSIGGGGEEASSSAPLAMSEGEALVNRPDEPQTLIEALQRAVRISADKGILIVNEIGNERFLSYSELWHRASCVLTGLRTLGLKPTDVVLFQFRDNMSFLTAFWACVMGGFLPAALGAATHYDERNASMSKLYNAWTLLERPLVLTDEATEGELREAVKSWPETEDDIRVVVLEPLLVHVPARQMYSATSRSQALNLLTSGSTGQPKCVRHRHQSVTTMAQSQTQALQLSSDDVWLNWMPLDHVGGLVMYHLTSVYAGCSQVCAKVEAFVPEPLRWLDWIDRYRVTVTWAPNFAFNLIVSLEEAVKERRWDLTSVRYVINGAEQIMRKTAQRFLTMLEPHGLHASAMIPAYGMSEISSAVVFSHTLNGHDETSGFHILRKGSLNGNVSPAGLEDRDSVSFAELGGPIPGVSIRIVDSANRLLREGRIGRLQVKGPTLMAEYYNNAEANGEVFTDDGWFHTGDLGFLKQGRLTLTGREKDVLIVNGNNYYNYEVEAFVEEVTGVDPTYAAACGIADQTGGSDRLVVFFSSTDRDEETRLRIGAEIREQLIRLVGIDPTYVIAMDKEEFPKTNSGKIQRGELTKRLLGGKYEREMKAWDIRTENEHTLPDWIYEQVWMEQAGDFKQEVTRTGTCVCFTDESGLGERFAKALGEETVVLVEKGGSFERLNEKHYRINPKEKADYTSLFEGLERQGTAVRHVMHLWGYEAKANGVQSVEQLREAQYEGVYSLLFIAQALGATELGSGMTLTAITRGMQAVKDGEPNVWDKAALAWMVKTMGLEYPGWMCRHVDLKGEEVGQDGDNLLREWQSEDGETAVAWREGVRWVPVLRKTQMEERVRDIPLREGGSYLISGGLGGIGRRLVAEMLRSYKARVLVIGRTPLPPRKDWTEVLAGPDEGMSERIRAYQELEGIAAEGGSIEYRAVRLSDLDELRRTVERVEQDWGSPLDGALHLAGTIEEELLGDQTVEQWEASFESKVYGTWAVHELLREREGTFLVCFSSARTLLPGLTLGIYNAGNGFMEAFTRAQFGKSPVRMSCCAWSQWDEIGMARGLLLKEGLRQMGYQSLREDQGIASLLYTLQMDKPVLYIGLDDSKEDIRSLTRTEKSKKIVVHVAFSREKDAREVGGQIRKEFAQYADAQEFGRSWELALSERVQLPVTLNGEVDRLALEGLEDHAAEEELQTEVERQLAEIWSRLLPVRRVGRHQNFFSLGGASLKVMQLLSAVRDRFQKAVTFRQFFAEPTLAGLARLVEMGEASKALPIPAAHSGKGGHPLSRAQRRQWFLYQWAPENPYYTNTMSIRIEGKLNMGALRQSVQAIVNRHEMLRTRFEEMDGKPLQIIEPYTPIQVPLIVVRSSAEAESMIQEEANTPFDLTRDPVIRTQVLRLKARAHILLVSIHHIASDGWSFGVFLDELSQLYEGYAAGGNPTLAELSIQYTDFAAWHEEQIQQGQFEKQMAYWKEVLQGELPVIDLPTDYPRPPQQRFRGKTLEWLLDKEATESVSELSQRNGVSQFMTLLSVYITLLFRYTGKEDLIVGTVIANRNRTEVEPLIGFFVNTLALRVQLANNNPTFQEILARVRDVATGANDHQDLPFEMLLDEMKVERELSRHPLFQTLFVMQQSYETKEANGNRFTMQAESGNTSKFDLSMFVQERDGKLLVQLEYNTDLFAEASMKQLFNHYLNLLQQVVTFPEQPVRGLPYLAETEIGQMQAWNETTRPYADDKCIHKLFEEQAARTPDAEAVVFEDETLTYAELNRRSNQLAHYLHQQGVGPESLVAICMERSVDLIVALLGVLKAGGAYVPLDPSYPPERLAYMLADSGVSVVVTTEKWLDLLSKDGVQTMCLDRDGSALDRFREDNPGAQASSDHVAYLIYTSGSTGHPKGVVIEHRSLLNLVLWHCGAYRVESRDRATLIAGVAFDASGWEIWPYLIKGASLYIPAEETRLMPSRLRDWMIGTGITLSFMPTPLAESMLGLVWPEETKIRYLLTGGDRLGQYAPEGLPFTLVNHYGPTENTVVTTAGTVPSEACEGVPHIGRPIANTQAFVLDDEMQLVPMGVSGELYVGGDGLARGYWNRPELTNEKFIVHPQWDKRLYRTGDLVRWQPEGNLEYLGRIDDQVKIRGYRIELGEIERFLLQMPQVREAVVLTIEDEYGNKKLSAFLSSVNRITMDEVCESLSPYLPTYMIPHHVFMVDSIPVTANGKVDRSALSSRFTSEQSKVYQPSGSPGSKTEMKITEIWLEELKHYVGEIPITANFFEVGGHSLIAGTVLSRIEETLGVSMSLAELFNRPTIKQLAEYVDSALPSRNDFKLQKAEEMQAYPVSSQQRGIYAIMQTDPWTVSYNMPVVFKVDDIQPDRLDKAVQMLLSRHEMLRASFFVEQGQIMYSILNTAEVLVEQLVGDETQWSEIVDGFVRPFTFHQAPIFRVGVIRFPLNYSMIIMDTHHIVADGLSMKLLVEEFINLYVGTHVNEMDGNLAFADYVTLQDKKETIGLEEQRAFWKGFLQGELPVLHLMTDYPRQPYQQLEGDRIRMELNETLVQQIRRAAFEWQVTPYTVFLASYSLLLSYITDQEEIIFGTVFNNRPHRWSQSVGMFINTLPLRISVPTDLTSPEFVAFVHRIVLECHARQDFPMDQMLQGFEIQRDMGRHPLFDTLFVYRHRELDFDREDGPLKTVDYTLRASKFEMTLEIVEKANKTLLELEYCTKLFKPASIQKIAIYYQRILEQMVDSSLMKANQIDPMTDNERREILFTFNDTNMEFTVEEPTVIHWLEKKIAEYPQQIAVKYGNQQITYRELWDKTGQVASYLHDRGIGSKQTVALLTSRSVDMVVSVIGVLRAGASYLPIDPNFPLERIRFMLEDSSAALMLTNINQWKFEFSLLPVEGVFLKDPVILERQPVFTCLQLPDPEEPAYVIYTSGSTGKPKGVMITHGSLMNLLLTVQYKYPTNFGDSYLLKTNYTFDVSIVELLGWCIGDGHLVIAEEETEKDLGAIHENVRRFGITHINFVPSLLKWFCSFCADSPLPSLKYIFVAGEAFPAELTNELIEVFPTAVIENIYGPTECTIYATSHTIKKDESSPVLIGRPLPNQKAYILDSKGRLRPKRFSGELCLSGKGVALGYVNSQANTTSQFVIKDGELLYRTGDLARWLEDGNIEYWGRIDRQVKVRGYRVETDEIKQTLSKRKDIFDAAIVAKLNQHGHTELAAYLISEARPSVTELRGYLREYLPDYMIPSHFIYLDQFPLTASGKVDLNQLPDLGKHSVQMKGNVEPMNAIEESMVAIWREILGVESIGTTDNFFELGGDSIKAIQIASKFNNGSQSIQVRHILSHQTIVDICQFVKIQTLEKMYDQGIVTADMVPTPIQHWFMEQYLTNPNYYNQSVLLSFHNAPDRKRLEQCFKLLITHHDGLRLNWDQSRGRFFINNVLLDRPFHIELVDLSHCGEDELEWELRHQIIMHKSGFNIESSILIKAVLFKCSQTSYRLFITAHHILVDGVSWRILLEDLTFLYQVPSSQDNSMLAEKTASLKNWTDFLDQYSSQSGLLKEREYWTPIEEKRRDFILPVDKNPEDWRYNNQEVVQDTLDELWTEILKTKCYRAFNTEVIDLLLIALARTLKSWTGENEFIIELESHGRHLEGIDLTRTVGWFTSLYPFLMKLPEQEMKDQVIGIKEQIRSIPNHGIGYGLFKYIRKEWGHSKQDRTAIRFNYLGQFDREMNNELFSLALATAQDEISCDNEMSTGLDINCMIVDRVLRVEISFNSQVYYQETMIEFCTCLLDHIKSVIQFVSEIEDRTFTPSDFDAADVNQQDLDQLFS